MRGATPLPVGLGAKRVPEPFVLDAEGVVRYRGRIDDRWLSPGKRTAHPTSPDLTNALDQVLAGKPVTVAKTEAVGCSAGPREKLRPAPGGAAVVTYYKDYAPAK